MRYNLKVDQKGKTHQYYPKQLTKYMSKDELKQFIKTFRGFKRADIMIKGNGKGKGKLGTGWAVFIKKNNKLRRKEDIDITVQLSDFLLSQIVLGRKHEGISLLRDFIK